MPSFLRVQVHEARGLPAMDTVSKLADPYVEVSFSKLLPKRTEVIRKTLNPVFDAAFKFEITDDADLVTEPVIFNVIDRNYISGGAIGSVAVSLEPLLSPVWGISVDQSDNTERPTTVSGWFPIYDTLEGIRGELLISLKLRFYGDLASAPVLKLSADDQGSGDDNDTNAVTRSDSSVATTASLMQGAAINNQAQAQPGTSVSFFAADRLDAGIFPVQILVAFVEELVVEDDPEYALSYSLSSVADTYRTARKTNEARQMLLHRLAYRLRAAIAAKVRALGGNAVIGYHQHFDIEGDSGIVARAYGTCATIRPETPEFRTYHESLEDVDLPLLLSALHRTPPNSDDIVSPAFTSTRKIRPGSDSSPIASGLASPGSLLPSKSPRLVPSTPQLDVDVLSLQHLETRATLRKETSKHLLRGLQRLNGPVQAMAETALPIHHNFVRRVTQMDDVQIFSVGVVPPGVRLKIGGLVAARSVKYLGRLHAKAYDQETRDRWWAELREELRSHAAKLSCSQIIGYRETAHICGDSCVLSVMGTAVQLRNVHSQPHRRRKRRRQAAEALKMQSQKLAAITLHSPGPLVMHADASVSTEPFSAKTTIIRPDEAEFSEAPPAEVSLQASKSGASSPWYLAPTRASVGSMLVHGVQPTVAAPLTPLLHGPGVDAGWMSTCTLTAAQSPCSMLHVPNEHRSAFNNMKLYQCRTCKRHWVPNVVLATIEVPQHLPTLGPGVLIEARVARRKDKATGEAECVRLSEELLFTEFQLHQQLLLKLKLQGRNAAFGIRSSVHFNGSLILGVMTATAVIIPALPPAPIPMPRRELHAKNDRLVSEIQAVATGSRDQLAWFAVHNAHSVRVLQNAVLSSMLAIRNGIACRLAAVLPPTALPTHHGNASQLMDAGLPVVTPDKVYRSTKTKKVSRRRKRSRGSDLDSSSDDSRVYRSSAKHRMSRASSFSSQTSSPQIRRKKSRRGRRRATSGATTTTSAGSSTASSTGSTADSSDYSDSEDTSSTSSSESTATYVSTTSDHPDRLEDGMTHYVVEMDDDQLDDLLLAARDVAAPAGVSLVSTEIPPPTSATADGVPIHPVQWLPFFDAPKRVGNILSDLEDCPMDSHLLAGASCPSLQPKALWMPIIVLRVPWADLGGDLSALGSIGMEVTQGFDMKDHVSGPTPRNAQQSATSAGGSSFFMGVAQALGFGSGTAAAVASAVAIDGDSSDISDSQKLAQLFHAAYSLLVFKVRLFAPCTICAVRTQLSIPEPDVVELLLTGMVIREANLLLEDFAPLVSASDELHASMLGSCCLPAAPKIHYPVAMIPTSVDGLIQATQARARLIIKQEVQQFVRWLSSLNSRTIAGSSPIRIAERPDTGIASEIAPFLTQVTTPHLVSSLSKSPNLAASSRRGRDMSTSTAPSEPDSNSDGEESEADTDDHTYSRHREGSVTSSVASGMERLQLNPSYLASQVTQPVKRAHLQETKLALSRQGREITLSPLSYVPGAYIKRYVGCVNMNFIRETMAVRQGGGLSSFLHAFIAEANAVLRAHAAALGGNAILCYRIVPRESSGKSARNQAYHLMSLSGDVVDLGWESA